MMKKRRRRKILEKPKVRLVLNLLILEHSEHFILRKEKRKA